MTSFREFPASAASTLIEGYCNDFIQFAASLAQTLEQIMMRKLDFGDSRASLERVERGMRDLADAIEGLLKTSGRSAPQSGGGSMPQTGLLGDRQPLAAKPAAPAQPAAPGPRPVKRPAPPVQSAMAAPTRDCVIQGSTDSMPMTSVFQFLTRMKKCGTLHVNLGEERLTFDIADGCVQGVTTNRAPRGERIGEMLVERGFVRPEQIAAIVQGKRYTVRELGTKLVRARRITLAQLQDTLKMQAQRRLQRVMHAKTATYEFHEGLVGSRPDHMQIRVPLQPPTGKRRRG